MMEISLPRKTICIWRGAQGSLRQGVLTQFSQYIVYDRKGQGYSIKLWNTARRCIESCAFVLEHVFLGVSYVGSVEINNTDFYISSKFDVWKQQTYIYIYIYSLCILHCDTVTS